ncbi:MAG: UDP-N-acetylglucosamine 2-epimerase (hydrolyzing) [Butyrivibrio sp.]|nr:UDP-N-acetylglucosamine 2-epimerase (hydrolyzing) [Butyrivibrio sp.]
MRKIGVVTATRAEFGLLKPLIQKLSNEDIFEVSVLVTGAHLSEEFGYTYKEIEEAGIPIAAKIECLTGDDNGAGITQVMAKAMTGFADYFAKNHLDLLIVLGDRYETMAVCIAAMNAGVPIAHIHGGETTEGAIDEAIRHSITKMSLLHFTATDIYRKRVIQLGEDPKRVFNVGALGADNIKHMEFIPKEELIKEVLEIAAKDGNGTSAGIYTDSKDENERSSNVLKACDKYAVVTYHPVTLDENSGVEKLDELLKALDKYKDMNFIITKANADAGGRQINARLDEYAVARDNVVVVTSLGAKRYLSAVKEAAAVIGNSSSGIIEAPCLHVPTVNIGDRQKGRLMPESVISCEPDCASIVKAIDTALSDDFRQKVKAMDNPFGDGETSAKIVEVLKKYFESNRTLDIKKQFYDIDIMNI